MQTPKVGRITLNVIIDIDLDAADHSMRSSKKNIEVALFAASGRPKDENLPRYLLKFEIN